MKLITIIMAAGKGKRMMNPERSKVMHEIAGKPMIEYVVQVAIDCGSDLIVPVVGHQKQSVIEFLNSRFSSFKEKIRFAHQDEQLGTGHAIMMTEKIVKGIDANILILSGDVPLLSRDTVTRFMNFHHEGGFDASLISAVLDDASGYGRVLRDESGNFIDIREHKDCSDEERNCREINSGIYLIDGKILFDALSSLKTDNVQGEYYLTDVFESFRNRGKSIGAFPVSNIAEISGINTIEQLQTLEKEYFSRSSI